MLDGSKREISDTYQKIIKLHALKPAPEIVFSPFIDLGFIQINKEQHKIVTFKNEGKEDGNVELKYETAKDTLKIEMSSFSLRPGEIKDICIAYRPKEAGLFRILIDVVVEGAEMVKHIDLNATPVEYTVHVIAPTARIGDSVRKEGGILNQLGEQQLYA